MTKSEKAALTLRAMEAMKVINEARAQNKIAHAYSFMAIEYAGYEPTIENKKILLKISNNFYKGEMLEWGVEVLEKYAKVAKSRLEPKEKFDMFGTMAQLDSLTIRKD